MSRLDEILARREEVIALAQKNRAGRMFVFGSCARLGLVLQEMFGCEAAVISSSALEDLNFGPQVGKDMVAV